MTTPLSSHLGRLEALKESAVAVRTEALERKRALLVPETPIVDL